MANLTTEMRAYLAHHREVYAADPDPQHGPCVTCSYEGRHRA